MDSNSTWATIIKIINLKSDDKAIAYAGNSDSQRTAMLAAFRLFHSMGYMRGYGDAMDDVANGKDRRVKAHLN